MENNIVEEIIKTIEEEIDESTFSKYYCKDGIKITTDVGYVYDWFYAYKEKLRERFCK